MIWADTAAGLLRCINRDGMEKIDEGELLALP